MRLKFVARRVTATIIIYLLTGRADLADGQAPVNGSQSQMRRGLEVFLRRYLHHLHSEEDKTTRYVVAFVDLNGDRKPEAIVHVTGETWCGSGGCNTLILVGDGASFKLITRLQITRPPIRVLSGITNGWRNIAVQVAGGGIVSGYDAELPFNGKRYPSNPTLPPAHPLVEGPEGEVVVSTTAAGTLLDR